MPPAFNLSQDQTLEFNLALLRSQSSTRASRRKTRFECGRKPTFVGNLNCPRTTPFDLEGRPPHRRRNANSTRLNFGVKPPRKKKLKIFRKARFFFSSEAPAVRPRPRQAESDVFYTGENKKQAPRRKIRKARAAGVSCRQTPPTRLATIHALATKRHVLGGISIFGVPEQIS